MTKLSIPIMFISTFAFGCGGSPTNDLGSTNTGGFDQVNETGGDPSTGGVEQNTGGAETGGMPNDGGAETGGMPNAGGSDDGGTVNAGGSSTGGAEIGAGGSPGAGGITGICVPKTCETIAFYNGWGQSGTTGGICGFVQDGCGNVINCGTCSNEWETCGGGKIEGSLDTHQTITDPGIPNKCDGGCVNIGQSNTCSVILNCATNPSSNATPPPWSNKICTAVEYDPFSTYSEWCCN